MGALACLHGFWAKQRGAPLRFVMLLTITFVTALSASTTSMLAIFLFVVFGAAIRKFGMQSLADRDPLKPGCALGERLADRNVGQRSDADRAHGCLGARYSEYLAVAAGGMGVCGVLDDRKSGCDENFDRAFDGGCRKRIMGSGDPAERRTRWRDRISLHARKSLPPFATLYADRQGGVGDNLFPQLPRDCGDGGK